MMLFSGGYPETLCGTGSTMSATEEIRGGLPQLLADLEVCVLLDAPCGDMHWISHVDLGDIAYIGADNNPANLMSARTRNETVVMHEMDIVYDPLPPADAMLCRDFHQHLPNAMVVDALKNFAHSDINWMIATRHVNAPDADIDCVGQFRPIDPCRWLGDPFMEIPDVGRTLAVWHRDSFSSFSRG